MSKASQKPGEPDDHAHELARHLEMLARRFVRNPTTRNVSRSQLVVLVAITRASRLTMSELAVNLGLAVSSCTGMVDALVERGLVARDPHPTDRRSVYVRLTARGRKLAANCIEDRASLASSMLEPLTPAERKRLLALFRKINSPKS